MTLPSYQAVANWYVHALPATGIIRTAADDVVLIAIPAIVAGFLLSFLRSVLKRRTQKVTLGETAAKALALGLFAYPIMMMLYLDAIDGWHFNRLIAGVPLALFVGWPMLAGAGLLWLADRGWRVGGHAFLVLGSVVFVVSCILQNIMIDYIAAGS